MKRPVRIVSVLLVIVLFVCMALTPCALADEKDLTGKWSLEEISIYGYQIKTEDYQIGDIHLSEICFDVLDDKKVQFTYFNRIFDAAVESILIHVGITEDLAEGVLPVVKSYLEEQGVNTSDIEKYYNDIDKLDYRVYGLNGDRFIILSEGTTVLDGVITDDNTITVAGLGIEDLELKFTRK